MNRIESNRRKNIYSPDKLYTIKAIYNLLNLILNESNENKSQTWRIMLKRRNRKLSRLFTATKKQNKNKQTITLSLALGIELELN